MAQNGFNRRSSNATRTYPGSAARLAIPTSRGGGGGSGSGGGMSSMLGTSTSPSSATSSSGSSSTPRAGAGSVPTMFVRPLSRSQLAPVHVGGGTSGGHLLSPSSPLAIQLPASARQISLDQPRPSSERHGNVYLGAPVSHHSPSSGGGGGGASGVGGSGLGGGGGTTISGGGGGGGGLLATSHRGSGKSVRLLDSKITAAEQVRLPTNSRTKSKKSHSDSTSSSQLMSSVVTSQPTKRALLKGDESSSSVTSATAESGGGGGGKVKLAESSITCPYCRKCRCEACATPRPLPSRWICSKSIHCGPEPFLDYVTCLCCVKAVFYHCGKNHEPDGGVMCADKPCSCAPHRKFWRWGCMGAMSVVLPCLCLYWPCRGCIGLAEKAYQKYHNNGCTCNHHQRGASSSLVPTSGAGLPPPLPPPPSSKADLASSADSRGCGLGGPLTDLSEDEMDHHRAPSRYSHPPVVATRPGIDKFLPFD